MQNPGNALDQLCELVNNFLITDSKTVTQDGRDGAHPANETGMKRPRSNDGFASDWYDCDRSDIDRFDDESKPVYADAPEVSLTSSAGLPSSTDPSRAPSPLPLRVLDTHKAHVRSGEAGSVEVEADVSCSEAGTSKTETLLTALEEDLGVSNHGSRYLHPAPRSWVDAPAPPQNCTTLEEELQMWKTEYLHQRQFIYRLSRKLASKRISVVVDTRPTIRPIVHRKLLDVVEVIAPTSGDRLKSFREHVNGAENEPQLTRAQLALDYTLQRGLALKDKLGKAGVIVKQAPHITVETPEISELKEQLSNPDLRALINDPNNHNTIRDLVAEQLAQHGIILDAQFDMDQIILRLSQDSSKPGYDPRNLDNVRQLFLERASSFGQDLRQSWGPVLGLLSERQFPLTEPSSYMHGFMIFQDLGNNGAWAAALKWPVKRLLREAIDILNEVGIPAEVGDNDQKLTFTGVATDGVGCLGVAIKCGLAYKNSLDHLEQSLRATCDIVTLNPYTTARGDASEQEDADLSFHTNLWTKVYEAWDRVHKRVSHVTELLKRYASVSQRIYHDTAGTTDCRALLVEAVQNVVATRQVRRFHADLVVRAPLRQHQAAAGSREERLLVQLEGREIRVFALEHEAGLRAVELDETQHRLRSLQNEVEVREARTAKVLEEAAASARDAHMERETILSQLQDKLYAAETRALELEAQIQRHDVELEKARKQTFWDVANEAVVKLKQAVAYYRSGAELPVWADTETAARRKMIKVCDLRRELEDACRTNDRLVHSLECIETELSSTWAEKRRSEAKVAALEQKVGETEEALVREKETIAELRQRVKHMGDEDRDLWEGISMALGREKATVSRLQGELDKTRKNRVDTIRKLKQGFDADVATLEEEVGEGQRALVREQENVARLEQQIEDLSNHNNALEVQLANQARLTATCTGQPTSLVRSRSNTAIAVQQSMVPALVVSTSSSVLSSDTPLTNTPSPPCAGRHIDTMKQQLHSIAAKNLTLHFKCVLETPIAQEHVPTDSPSHSTDGVEESSEPSEVSSQDSLHSCQFQFDSEEEPDCVNSGRTLDVVGEAESSLQIVEDYFDRLSETDAAFDSEEDGEYVLTATPENASDSEWEKI
ncbi:hypothetical protein DL768_005449 [Monosporascus sp. mg162]|nr:hypothetical protein DL768_005449 [Monosporascus sp. mg162]